ncbi:MAG TPA: hypothetical protein VI653_05965 [Steroidobacteraceae bacterium]
MNRVLPPLAETTSVQQPGSHRVLHRIFLHCLLLLFAAAAFVAYEHFKLNGQSTAALASLLAAGILVLAPVRALIGEFFAIEGKALHALHGLGGLVFVGLAAGGVISGQPLLDRAAMAPFAIMGAAQAIMHQDHPRNAKQAEAVRRFATSLPEVAELTRSGSLTSPANAARAVRVLNDLISKAEALGETELQADPNFQSAWAQATTRTGLTLGLDAIDQAINRLAANPAAAPAVPELRRRLAQARTLSRTAAHH